MFGSEQLTRDQQKPFFPVGVPKICVMINKDALYRKFAQLALQIVDSNTTYGSRVVGRSNDMIIYLPTIDETDPPQYALGIATWRLIN